MEILQKSLNKSNGDKEFEEVNRTLSGDVDAPELLGGSNNSGAFLLGR
ncbi:hypothetical protein BAOM_1081 [Peribacillus asahii]|uniref:Uncharacterized protein n=1 Tax=Peribacillus asahii TaxID=228899 RepID=A0A3Q9RL45_9BACI|nr:hypothetical protein BAOM_1081 [Peribacillus asahii]